MANGARGRPRTIKASDEEVMRMYEEERAKALGRVYGTQLIKKVAARLGTSEDTIYRALHRCRSTRY